MIWFFLAGMVAGAVGAVMVIWWWVKKNIRQVTKEEMLRELEKAEEKRKNQQ